MMPRFSGLGLSAVLAFSWFANFASASADSAEEDSALGNNSSTEYFSVPAFFITFRETIEVCNVCAHACAGAAVVAAAVVATGASVLGIHDRYRYCWCRFVDMDAAVVATSSIESSEFENN